MLFRRNIALAAGVLVLAVPTLSSCGFNYATDRVNTNAAGVNNRDKTVDVLSAVIVATQADSGTFIASFSNNSQTESAAFDTLLGAGGSTVTAADFDPVEIAPKALVNLAVDGGVALTGTFEAGDFIAVSVGFANGDHVLMKIPVVTNCGIYEGLDTSADHGAAPEAPYSCEYPTLDDAHSQ